MNMVPVIIDHARSNGASGPVSLLGLPLATGTVLDQLVARLSGIQVGGVRIISDFCDPAACARHDGGLSIEVLKPSALPAAFDRHETCDYLLVLEAKHWLGSGLDLVSVLRSAGQYYGATHGVAMGSVPDGASEWIECEADGRVKRVRRLFDMKNWQEVAADAVVYSVVPARSASGLRFASLGELRQQLAAKGVLSRDVPEPSELMDLTDEPSFLLLNERILLETFSHEAAWPGYEMRGPGVLAGHGSEIDASVRLVGPVVIQQDARIDAGATVIGPAVIGSGSRIGRGATVVQSVVGSGATVWPDVSLRHRLCLGACDLSAGGVSALQSPSGELDGTRQPGRKSDRAGHAAEPELRPGRRINLAIKRGVDIAVSLVSLLVLSPLLAVVAVLVKLDSAGSVFFCHQREGKGGREFPCIKFRTMHPDAHSRQRDLYRSSQVDGPQFKLADDPRVTRVGRWLRATNIDELPQLLNVLAGHMSLVGPRPSPFRENQICVPWRRARLSVRPGITGLWQVCRDDNRSRGGFHEWIYYDMIYVRHFSAWLDIKIVLATFGTLAGRWRMPLSWLVRHVEDPRGSAWSLATEAGQDEGRVRAEAVPVRGGGVHDGLAV